MMENNQLHAKEGAAVRDCPTCSRPLENFTDYPEIDVLSVTFPEKGITPSNCGVMDVYSGPMDCEELWKQFDDSGEFKNYLNYLGQIPRSTRMKPSSLFPNWEKDRYFRWAHIVPVADAPSSEDGTADRVQKRVSELFLGLRTEGNLCTVKIYRHGPNFGSGGGATLSEVGVVASIAFVGILND